jgi:two-component sensor histidine kinase
LRGFSSLPASIRQRLIILILLISLPLVMATLFVVRRLAVDQAEGQRAALVSGTRALAAAVDAEINRHFATAVALSTSRALANREFSAFHAQASEAVKALPSSWILLVDESGQQLLNTLRPYGEPLTNVGKSDAHRRVMETLKPVVSNVVVGQVSGRATTGVFYPVIRDGRILYDLIVTLSPENLASTMRAQKLPEGWLNGVMDRSGNFVARNVDHERLVGKPASPDWRAAAQKADEGFFEGTSVEGEPTQTFFVNSKLSGWSVAIGASRKALEMPITQTLWQVGLFSSLLIGLGIASALWFAGRIAWPLKQLENAATELMQGNRVSIARTGLREVNSALEAFEVTSSALADRQQRQQMLVNELNHRVKNTMSMIHSVAVLAARSATDTKDLMSNFTTRLFGISRTQDLLMQSQWAGAQVRELANSELAPYDTDEKRRVTLSGDSIQLSATQATSVGMVLHELTTNAVKYGALSSPDGKVAVTWTISGGNDGRRLRIEWQESGGPTITPPEREGFGSRLIETSVRRQLGGTLTADYAPEGLRCTIEFSLEAPSAIDGLPQT